MSPYSSVNLFHLKTERNDLFRVGQSYACELEKSHFIYCHSKLVLFYVSGDVIGKILAWCSLLPIFIIIGFITLIVFRRENHTVRKSFLPVLFICKDYFFVLFWRNPSKA